MKRLIVGLAVTAVVLLGGQAPAFAHNSLVEAAPAKEAALTEAPAEVKLRWLATLNPASKMTVTDASGANAIGEVKIDGKFLSAPFTGKVSGKYAVAYEVPSDDGHPIAGSYTFTLTLPEPVKLTESPTPTPTPAPASAPASAEAAAAPKSEETSWFPWVGGAAVAGLLVGGVITLLRNRRKSA